jgi:hypothetical protein
MRVQGSRYSHRAYDVQTKHYEEEATDANPQEEGIITHAVRVWHCRFMLTFIRDFQGGCPRSRIDFTTDGETHFIEPRPPWSIFIRKGYRILKWQQPKLGPAVESDKCVGMRKYDDFRSELENVARSPKPGKFSFQE